MKNRIVRSVLLFMYIVGFCKAQTFLCYKCNSNESNVCVDEPNELPPSSLVECEGFCMIVRTEHTDIPGSVVTLVRDCEKEPLVKNDVRTDKHYTKMYTACESNRCNSGDGKREPEDGDGPTGPKDVIRVPESSSSWMNKASLIFTMGTIFVYLLH